MAAAKPFIQRLVPRISLRNLLLLMTCVALAIALWQVRQQIGPMRTEIAALRTELGYLTINDPTQINAIQIHTGDPLVGEWRIYLPPGRKYRVKTASGFLPDAPVRSDRLDKIRGMGVVADVGPVDLSGEFTLTARLVKQADEWRLQLKPGGSAPINQPNGDWLSDGRSRGSSSDVTVQEQKLFPPDRPIMLMHMRRPVFTEGPNNTWSSTSPVGDADSIVLWIEPEPIAEGKK
jgi:hypothetical protein